VHLSQGIQQREAVGNNRGVVVFLEEDRAEMEEVVERL
jgi:hypothetical protein